MAAGIRIYFVFSLIMMFAWQSTQAQVLAPDTAQETQVRRQAKALPKTDDDKPGWSRPAKAALYSAVIPGAGQVYNKKYWKVPIIYATAGVLGYFFIENHNQYTSFRDAYRIRTDGDTNTIDAYATDPRFAESRNDGANNLQNFRDYYRRNRDLTIVLGVVAYALNIVDAHVDAHLRDFDISDDLSLKVQPDLLPLNRQQYIPGVSVTFALKNR